MYFAWILQGFSKYCCLLERKMRLNDLLSLIKVSMKSKVALCDRVIPTGITNFLTLLLQVL